MIVAVIFYWLVAGLALHFKAPVQGTWTDLILSLFFGGIIIPSMLILKVLR